MLYTGSSGTVSVLPKRENVLQPMGMVHFLEALCSNRGNCLEKLLVTLLLGARHCAVYLAFNTATGHLVTQGR